MLDRKDSQSMPTQQDISQYIHNPLWDLFYQYMIDQYLITPKYGFSKCSWEYGWNIKMKKSQKTLCTIYPRENYFTVMVVIGKKEKDSFEQILPCLLYTSGPMTIAMLLENTYKAYQHREEHKNGI